MAAPVDLRSKLKLAAWEAGTVIFVCVAGSALHFAFELSGYWKPIAVIAAVNESAWEHTKMYFWPGLLAALIQYTYTRKIANNYWWGKTTALVLTPIVIWTSYFSYMDWVRASGGKASLPIMLSIMLFGIALGQFASWLILTRRPFATAASARSAAAPLGTVGALALVFASFTYFPPRIFLFENFFCYQYTGEYGILNDYTPYRVFFSVDGQGRGKQGGGVNYCAAVKRQAVAADSRVPMN